jgi:hypothetical protein
VGRAKRLDPFKGDGMIRLGEYFGPFTQAAEYRPQFARAGAQTVERVVDEIYK